MPQQLHPATFWEREAAWGLEFIPLQVVLVLVAFVFPSLIAFVLTLILICVYIVLNAYMESKYGGNVGKYVLGLSVITEDNSRLDFSQALFRQTACGISWITMNIGHVMAMFRTDKKTLHDLMTQTRVVQKEFDIPSLPYVFPQSRSKFMMLSFALQIAFTLIVTSYSVIKAIEVVEKAMAPQTMMG